MKKFYIAAMFLAANFSLAQTTTVTFEDLVLDSANAHYNGSDMSGGFTSGGVFFENSYDSTYDYWSGGFIYSNTTDVTTAGYTNDFSAYAGGGANGSSNYGVFYGNGGIDFGTTALVSAIDVTNNTYAGLSMLNGDFYGKQFGDSTNAQGVADGTNGEDWFRLLIIGRDGNAQVTDTVVFYLADYRFADNSQDYIVNTWETVDLTPLGAVRYLDFELESSDVGGFGMNTPAYFALDNFVYGSLSVNENLAANLSVYPNPASSKITFKGLTGTVSIYSTAGQLMTTSELNGLNDLNVSEYTNGTYFYAIQTTEGIVNGRFVKQN